MAARAGGPGTEVLDCPSCIPKRAEARQIHAGRLALPQGRTVAQRWLTDLASRQTWIFIQLDFALLSLFEQAFASASLGDFSLPTVAQPAFVTKSLRE